MLLICIYFVYQIIILNFADVKPVKSSNPSIIWN